jgi:hypothetical protein
MVASKSGIAVGLNKGHITTRRELKAKPSNKIGVCIVFYSLWISMDGFLRNDMDYYYMQKKKYNYILDFIDNGFNMIQQYI